MTNLKKLSAKEANVLLAQLDKQNKERESQRAYQPAGIWRDGYTIQEVEKGAYGPVIKLESERQAYPHRSLEECAVGTVCDLVLFQAPEDKVIEANGRKISVKKGATKIMAYPVE